MLFNMTNRYKTKTIGSLVKKFRLTLEDNKGLDPIKLYK